MAGQAVAAGFRHRQQQGAASGEMGPKGAVSPLTHHSHHQGAVVHQGQNGSRKGGGAGLQKAQFIQQRHRAGTQFRCRPVKGMGNGRRALRGTAGHGPLRTVVEQPQPQFIPRPSGGKTAQGQGTGSQGFRQYGGFAHLYGAGQ